MTIATMPTPGATAELLLRRYREVRETTARLCHGLSAEDCMVQSMADASPAKWHLAHTTWFFETFILATHVPGYRPINPEFRFLFNSYYNAIGEKPQRDRRGVFSRPSLEEVRDYREHVDAAMLRLLESASPVVAALVELGLNHEQQHQELIVTDVKHALWSNPLHPAYRSATAVSAEHNASGLGWVKFPGGIVDVGHDGNGFCFDNELPRHQQLAQPFALASRLITNAEYLDFMRDGGYSRPELWLSDGWETVRANQWKAPLYWSQQEHEDTWSHYTCFGMEPVDARRNAPVTHISYYEADAFARWAGARLATEFEWEAVARQAAVIKGNLLEDGNFHPSPAPSGESPAQLFGDCWEWTQSAYSAYLGYRPAEGALGEYNGKFMCNQFVLRGGSCVTPRSHIRASYRNFFPPAARWQFSGIRPAKDIL
jgi:ergothioneine biosynthesis protein EgtB